MMRASTAGILTRKQQIENFATTVTDDWLWFQLNRQEGGSVIRNASGVVQVADLALTGTPGTIWSANPGWATPAGAVHVDVHTASVSTLNDLCAMLDMSALTSVGGMLLSSWVYMTGSAAAADYIAGLSGGGAGQQAAYGQVEWSMYEDDVRLAFRNVGGSTLLTCTAPTISGSHLVTFFVDGVNMTCQAYLDGVPHGSTLDLSTDGTTLPAIRHDWGIRLLGKPNDAAGGTINKCGAGNAALRVHDVVIRRFERDVSADIAEMIADMGNAGAYLLPASFGQI